MLKPTSAPLPARSPRTPLAAAGAFAAALALALGLSMATLAPARAAAAKMAPGAYAAGPVVKMTTTKGVILIKLFPKDAPISCANFLMLVKQGFYNGLMFHRVTDLGGAPGLAHIVQGGDPNSRHANPAAVKAQYAAHPEAPIMGPNGQALGNGGSPKEIKGEFASNGVINHLTHNAGAVAMARSQDNNSASSQFYICTTAAHDLDNNYAVFGMVIQGLPNAAKIEVGDQILKAVVVK